MRKYIISLLLFCAGTVYAVPDRLWDILICTLDERQVSFNTLVHKLQKQIDTLQLQEQVGIRYFKDNRQHSIGFKRNSLVAASTAKYICFVDDDDDVHTNYVGMIYEKLLTDPDCVSLMGIMLTNGANPLLFVHSKKYNTYFDHEGVFYRPPNHLNPIRRTIASCVKFPEINKYEDTNWSLTLAAIELVKTEAEITEPYYLYLYDGKYHRN